MDINHLGIPKEKAKEELEAYKEIMKRHKKEKWIKQTAKMYGYLEKGKMVIDVYEVFKKTGLKNDLPKLAIAKADDESIIFNKNNRNSGSFGQKSSTNWGWEFKSIVRLPRGTFNYRTKVERKKRFFEARTPIIPARFIPQDGLWNYYLLWEVDKWNRIEMPPRPDPYLLKKITENLFVVLASWELTDLEKRIIRKK